MNLAPSLAESYIYADMFNRGGNGYGVEYDLDRNAPERIMGGGAPVDYIVPSISAPSYLSEGGSRLNKDEDDNKGEDKKSKGPFADKVVPVGLVIIQSRRDADVEYDDHFHPGMNREVVSESLYETLMSSVMGSDDKSKSPKRQHPITKKNRKSIRKNTK
jgi:hypothetical protein